MAGKKVIAAPIDRPLSKAYLRGFGGWATVFPPGTSNPTSLRVMENIMVTRGGALRIRPALRSVLQANTWLDQNYASTMVGGFERFFLNDGTKALLFAARQTSGIVSFKVAAYDAVSNRFTIKNLTDAGVGFSIPQGESTLNFSSATKFVKYLQIDNKIFALSDAGEALRLFNVGTTKKARKVTPITVPAWDSASAPTVGEPISTWINNPVKNTVPAAQTPSTWSLISSDTAANQYSYGFFYTFENEVGESAPSQTQIIRAQRGWAQWQFTTANPDGGASTTPVTDPKMAVDQLVAALPNSVFTAALMQGALRWNLYMFTWSDQDVVPPEGILVASRDLTETGVSYASHGWAQATAAIDISTASMPLPTQENRYNYSDPATASQGLVAGDRLVLVNDHANGAVIRWSSNLVGEYTNFTPSKGGGIKTLTTGNLFIPASVKLWQNPQSVDSICILCAGVDGYSTAYYMSPGSVNGQSASTPIMSFEETTATPGTVSPYGVEVLNNALYHPLDTELMKSTAANYNINHATMSMDIANMWLELINKDKIVSSQHDNRLYYLVHNPFGEALLPGCNGNEIWVYDAAQAMGSWSRWLVQGIALSKLQVGGKLYMGISRPEGIFVFDELKATDDTSAPGTTVQKPIAWKLETNTQGANRAHDMWGHLQQVNVTLGNWSGALRYGIRGTDVYGQPVEISKDRRPTGDTAVALAPGELPRDLDQFLLVRRDLKAWTFFAESLVVDGAALPSYGEISYAQYRYTPVTVNPDYELGSTETLEYVRDIGAAELGFGEGPFGALPFGE